MMELIQAPTDQDLNIADKIHIAADPNLFFGDWGYSWCGLWRQIIFNEGPTGATCPECLFRCGQNVQ